MGRQYPTPTNSRLVRPLGSRSNTSPYMEMPATTIPDDSSLPTGGYGNLSRINWPGPISGHVSVTAPGFETLSWPERDFYHKLGGGLDSAMTDDSVARYGSEPFVAPSQTAFAGATPQERQVIMGLAGRSNPNNFRVAVMDAIDAVRRARTTGINPQRLLGPAPEPTVRAGTNLYRR